jgi:hydroxymethylbilane synthase
LPSSQTIRIATRASNLALWQAHHIADLIRQADPSATVELIHVSTTGDRDQTERLRDLGSLGVFTREVQNAVLDGRADIAVHSLKDLPTEPVPGLVLAATPARGATADALVLPAGHAGEAGIRSLAAGARIGTGSPRRQAQLRFLRGDLDLSEVRGNVETRLRKLDGGEYDALVLATAGLTRLGLAGRISCELAPPEMFPAVSQGAVGVECRADDEPVRRLLAGITDQATLAAATAERSLLSTLRAGCHAPLGVSTTVSGNALQLEAVILPQDGSHRWMACATAPAASAVALGQQVAHLLLVQGADRVLSGTV